MSKRKCKCGNWINGNSDDCIFDTLENGKDCGQP